MTADVIQFPNRMTPERAARMTGADAADPPAADPPAADPPERGAIWPGDSMVKPLVDKIELGAAAWKWSGADLLRVLAWLGDGAHHSSRYGRIKRAWLQGRREPWQLHADEARSVVALLSDSPKLDLDVERRLAADANKHPGEHPDSAA